MAKVMAWMLVLLIFLTGCGPGPVQDEINPDVQLDPEKTYTVHYWDVELPGMWDGDNVYRQALEELVARFCGDNPAIQVEIRWLNWTEAEQQLEAALKSGNPPDLWADWQGVAYWNHPLQVPADLWLDRNDLVPAGKQVAMHAGQIWSWPQWLWPRGLLALQDSLEQVEEQPCRDGSWDWQEFMVWLEDEDMELIVNDWQGGFSTQALRAATGHGFGRWGGQELHEVFAALELLQQAGQTRVGGYNEITQGKTMLGGSERGLGLWLAENLPQSQYELLPLPGMAGQAGIPVDSMQIIQFRQKDFAGDDHCRAAAMLAQYIVEQGGEMAPQLGAGWAWEEEGDNEPSPMLQLAREQGVPAADITRKGRQKEQQAQQQLSDILTDFWAGKANSQDVASFLIDFQ